MDMQEAGHSSMKYMPTTSGAVWGKCTYNNQDNQLVQDSNQAHREQGSSTLSSTQPDTEDSGDKCCNAV
jgi:hypothetical protein